MVVVFRPHVSRWRRAFNALKAKPQYWINNYTELFWGSVIVIPLTALTLYAKFSVLGPVDNWGMGWNIKPYYREFYEVRRPDEKVALKWRVPEEYPAYFQTNRMTNEQLADAHYAYAWDVK